MVHPNDEKFDLSILIITVSSTRNIDNDETGKKLENLFKMNGYRTKRTICRDNESEILKNLFCNYENDVFVLDGGTGASKLDVTVQAVSRISDKEIKGFGELFRQSSGGILPYISNAGLFLRDNKQIYCIPGSPDAVEVAYKLIEGMMNHLYREITKE